jgi:preprotein translocase subunit SecF
MELFKNTNFDFLGYKWPFIIASLVLTVAGLTSIALKGGIKYGIDFRSGAMYVKFTGPPPVETSLRLPPAWQCRCAVPHRIGRE